MNPSERAMTLFSNNIDKINALCWVGLSSNPSDGAMTLLENNIDKIDWSGLSMNSSERAMTLLAQNIDKINLFWLFYNPNIFEYNYDSMQNRCNIYKEDLIKNRFHPRNIFKFNAWGVEGFEDE